MNDDLMRQVGSLQTTVDDIKKPEISRNVITPFASLPGLIGLWYGGNYQRSTGDMPNLAPYISGASSQDLSYNGNPTFNYLSNGVGYADLDGTGDYFSVADNTDLDILGTESYVSNPGLTIGGWFNTGSIAAGTIAGAGKWVDAGSQSAYLLYRFSASLHFVVSSTGAYNGNMDATSTIAMSANNWFFWVGRFIPSTEVTVFVNKAKTTKTVAIGASIFNSNAAFGFAAYNNWSGYWTGYISNIFLCASALNDATIQSLFQQTRSLYGV